MYIIIHVHAHTVHVLLNVHVIPFSIVNSHGMLDLSLGNLCLHSNTGKGSLPSLGSCTSLTSTVSSTR